MGELRGLSKAKALYEGRDRRARELKAEGKQIIGYMCYFAPPEILEAAGLVAYRIRGDIREPVTHADQYAEPYGCPFVRSTFDLAAKGRYDFLDGLVMAHACDSVQRMYGIWTHYRRARFTHLLNVPHVVTPWSERFFRRELELFKERVEQFVGAPIDSRRLQATVDLHNDNREMIWELYGLRKAAPPLITGTEMLELLIAGSGIPAGEFNTLLQEVKAEVTSRPGGSRGNQARLLFYGCINDDVALIRLLEECAADVVMDDTCIGARGLLGRVTDDGDPLAGFTRYYFTGFHCPRTYRGTDRTRFDYLIHSAREFDIHGVVLYLLGFCDPHKLDVVDLREYLEAAGFPCLVLEDDYTLANLEAMRTRVQAFVEMIS
ncbi:MAG: 2-hydroxyacyl-CoA dehydratase subunit D [Candidatus Methylomirabilia bacterium]